MWQRRVLPGFYCSILTAARFPDFSFFIIDSVINSIINFIIIIIIIVTTIIMFVVPTVSFIRATL